MVGDFITNLEIICHEIGMTAANPTVIKIQFSLSAGTVFSISD